ncbi:MAG TPA: ABC transporter [Ruminococcaceae bacterium]|nr:ABC transporter permease subunit [Oscillospiraceae bacterium]HCA72303.1 ABC transporter [Oscillospiraceae bacterium]HCC01194.1 ABC transporter [Oscillospiraceae bacterium]HCM24082.1 ABC transporter [Oscillospiraceae bacterium]
MKLPGFLSKLIDSRETALIKKDFKEMWQNMIVRTMLVFVPLLFVVLLPILFMVLAKVLPSSSMQGMEQMRGLLTEKQSYMNNQQALFAIYSDYLSPMLFLIVPLMTACVTAANSFVGEKERSTMETLFLTPLTAPEIFDSKVLGCVGLSAISSLISFVLYAIVMSVGDVLLEVRSFWTNPNWIMIVFLLSPALIVFGVLFMVLVSGRSHSFMESVQICGYVLFPLILIYIGQFTGAFRLNAVSYLLISFLIMIIDFIIWKITSVHFTPEKLLR